MVEVDKKTQWLAAKHPIIIGIKEIKTPKTAQSVLGAKESILLAEERGRWMWRDRSQWDPCTFYGPPVHPTSSSRSSPIRDIWTALDGNLSHGCGEHKDQEGTALQPLTPYFHTTSLTTVLHTVHCIL
jgi:hypothetical protein